MRMILHDWSDEYCVKILKHIRAAAAPDSYLLIIDNVTSYACSEKASNLVNIPGVQGKLPPAPLLPNNGHANVMGYLADIQVFKYKLLQHISNVLMINLDDDTFKWPRTDFKSAR